MEKALWKTCILVKRQCQRCSQGRSLSRHVHTAERRDHAFSSSHAHPWQIKAFALNRMDIMQREGNYPGIPAGSSNILGVEFSGHITALGPNTSQGWQTGDEVLGLASGVSWKFLIFFSRKDPTLALIFALVAAIGGVRRMYRGA